MSNTACALNKSTCETLLAKVRLRSRSRWASATTMRSRSVAKRALSITEAALARSAAAFS